MYCNASLALLDESKINPHRSFDDAPLFLIYASVEKVMDQGPNPIHLFF